MAYILSKDRPQNTHEEWQAGWSKYSAYLESVKDLLPRSTYEFASASWHYDFSDPRSPHDGWVEDLMIREPASGERKEGDRNRSSTSRGSETKRTSSLCGPDKRHNTG